MTTHTTLGSKSLKEAGFTMTMLMSGEIAFTKPAAEDTFIAISLLDHVAEDLNVTAETAKVDDHVWIATRYTNDQSDQIKVAEPLSLEITLGELDRLPPPHPNYETEYSNWISLRLRDIELQTGKKINSLAKLQKALNNFPEFKKVFDEGFIVETLGGGTTGFLKYDHETKTTWVFGNESTCEAHPKSKDWGLIRETNECGYVQIASAEMSEILENYKDLPALPEDCEEQFDYDNFEEFRADKDNILAQVNAPAPR